MVARRSMPVVETGSMRGRAISQIEQVDFRFWKKQGKTPLESPKENQF